jgi:hypothetical protein
MGRMLPSGCRVVMAYTASSFARASVVYDCGYRGPPWDKALTPK